MLQQKTGVGVIGCGTISDVYLTNIKEHYHNLEVIACADMYPEKAEQTKEKYGIPTACTPEELLADEKIEIVLNLTVPAVHYQINMQILNAGKHVYCEKPLALSLEEADTIVNTAREKGLLAVSAPDTFLGAGAQTCRKLLDEGTIGRPVGFTANMVAPGHELWHPAPAFYYKKGAGPMLDMGPYYITALVSLLGPIQRISCFAVAGKTCREIQGKMVETEVPTHYAGIMEFACKAVGNINMSFDVWDSDLPVLEIYGTDGALSVPDPNMFGGEVKIYSGKKLKSMVDAETRPHPAKLMTMVSRKGECSERVDLLFPADPDPRCNMRGLGLSDMARALKNNRASRLNSELSRHVVEALAAFQIAADTNTVYEMKTTCKRPEAMPEGLMLWDTE